MPYVIRNCPACHNYYSNIYECHQMDDCDDNSCSSYTDCVIKQVIEKCKKVAKDHYWGMREIRFSKEILQLFDIEEIRE